MEGRKFSFLDGFVNFKDYILILPVILFGARTDHTGARRRSFVGSLELAVWKEKKNILGKFSHTDTKYFTDTLDVFPNFFLRSVNLLFDKTRHKSTVFQIF